MIFDIKSISNKELEEDYEKAMKELDEFFKLNWKRNKPQIFVVEDRKTINKLREKETEKWMTGWVYGKNIYVLKKENFEKESSHGVASKESYFRLIKHELAHCFFLVLSNHKTNPDWLWEGVSIYLSGQLKHKEKPAKLESFLGYWGKSGRDVYKESGFAVEILVEKYGKEKLLELIKSLKDINSEEDFNKKFEEIYGVELNYDLFNEI